LKISERQIRDLFGRFLTIKLLIRSWPGTFLVGSFFIMRKISPEQVGFAGKVVGRGDSSEHCSTSKLSFIGTNVMWLKIKS